ncbi:MAG: hypothetical protein K6A92_01090 [Lachnospiraceae bacterium]|nr:hypothetical protein [Lachnospiraceae bacterium]
MYEGISLSPGVYEITLQTAADLDMAALISLKAETTSPYGLRCINGIVYQGLDHCTFSFYLYEKTDDLKVSASAGQAMTLQTGAMQIRNTGQLYTMGAFWLTCLLAITLIVIQIQTHGVNRQQKITILSLGVISVIAVLPLLYGGSLITADGGYHMMRIESLAEGLKMGQIPVRIEPYWQQSYGYADSIFYCNLFLIFPAILRLLGFGLSFSWNAYCVAIRVAAILTTYYCSKKIFENYRIALAVTAMSSLSVIQFFKGIQTGAIGEATAYIFLPLVLYGFWRILFQDTKKESYRTAFIPLAVGFAGIVQCHVLSSEISALVAVLIVVFQIRRLRDPKVIGAILKAAALAVMLSLWFLVPFVDYYLTEDVHIKFVFARTIQQFGIQIPQMFFHFWNSGAIAEGTGMYQAYPAGLGLIFAISLGWFATLMICNKKKNSPEKLQIIETSAQSQLQFAKLCLGMSVLLCIFSLRIFPWGHIQTWGGPFKGLVSSLQFPNRFLGWATLFASMVFGYLLSYYEIRKADWQKNLLYAMVLIQVATSSLFYVDAYMAGATVTHLSNREGMGNGYISGGEYIIQGTDDTLLTYNRTASSEEVQILEFTPGELSGSMEVNNTGNAEGYVEFPLLHYKGYRAYDAQGQKLPCEKGDNHVVRVMIPAGYKGIVRTLFREPFYWRIAEILSLCGYVVFFFLYLKGRKKRTVTVAEPNGREIYSDQSAVLRFDSSAQQRSLFVLCAGVFLAWTPALATYNISGMLHPEALARFSGSFQEVLSRGLILGILLMEGFAAYGLFSVLIRKTEKGAYGALLGTLGILLSPYNLCRIYCAGENPMAQSTLADLWKAFAWRGAASETDFHSYPLQLGMVWITVTILYILLALRKKQRSIWDRKLACVTCLTMVLACGTIFFPALLIPAGILAAIQLAVFTCWLFELEEDRQIKVWIYLGLLLLLVLTASMQLEDICYQGYPGEHGFI